MLKNTQSGKGVTHNKYLKGAAFWENHAFWRTGMYSAASQKYFEKWLVKLGQGERSLTRLRAEA